MFETIMVFFLFCNFLNLFSHCFILRINTLQKFVCIRILDPEIYTIASSFVVYETSFISLDSILFVLVVLHLIHWTTLFSTYHFWHQHTAPFPRFFLSLAPISSEYVYPFSEHRSTDLANILEPRWVRFPISYKNNIFSCNNQLFGESSNWSPTPNRPSHINHNQNTAHILHFSSVFDSGSNRHLLILSNEAGRPTRLNTSITQIYTISSNQIYSNSPNDRINNGALEWPSSVQNHSPLV